MGAKILCATSYPTHETRGWCGRRFFLGIPFSAKQASNRGIDAPAFFDFFFSTFSTLFVLTYFSTLFVTVFVQYSSSDSSVTHMRLFLLLHSTGADLGDLLGGLAQPRAADLITGSYQNSQLLASDLPWCCEPMPRRSPGSSATRALLSLAVAVCCRRASACAHSTAATPAGNVHRAC